MSIIFWRRHTEPRHLRTSLMMKLLDSTVLLLVVLHNSFGEIILDQR
jgi:hypothetical protein